MAKLQHFTNSKVSMSNFEPLYVALFEANITPPPAIAGESEWSSGKEIILEEITDVSGLDVDLAPGNTTQEFKGATRNFAGVIPDNTSVTFNITFNLNLNDANQDFIYNAFRKWGDLIYDPLTATQQLKKDYISPSGLTLTRFNKVREVYRRIEIKNVYVSSKLPERSDKYGSKTEIESMTVQFTGDYFNNSYT